MAGVLISPYMRDFLSYQKSFLDILEGVTGSGKTVIAIKKFFDKVYVSPSRVHIISCQSTMKTEQNIINDDNCGAIAMYDGLVQYYPHGRGNTTTPHLTMQGADGKEKIIYFISYADKTKWETVRAGRYGCFFIDECNLVPNDEPGSVPKFVTEALSRTDEYIVMTLNPDDPEKEIYQIINQARPVRYYKNKGPKQTRAMLNLPENPEYKWWFFDFADNLTMTPERVRRIADGCKGNEKDYNSRILGLRTKSELLAFPGFADKNILSFDKIEKQFKYYTDENGKQVKPVKQFKNFYCGVDTSYSHKTDDLIAFVFTGITTNGEVYVLDEFTWNNRDHVLNECMSASDIPEKLKEFLTYNSKTWGYPKFTFVDEADANLLLELSKHPIGFNLSKSAKSKFPIPTRMKLINDLINHGKYYVCDKCTMHIHEMDVMTIDAKDKTRPDDKNNHTYDAMCYAVEKEYLMGTLTNNDNYK